MTKDAIVAKAPASRVKRTPIGRRNLLTVSGKEPGFEHRIVNDKDDRIQMFLEAGWEIVPQEGVKFGDKRVEGASAEGSLAQLSVGGGQKAYLMRIKDEYYKEDQAAKQAQVHAIEAQTKQKALDGNYGSLEISRK